MDSPSGSRGPLPECFHSFFLLLLYLEGPLTRDSEEVTAIPGLLNGEVETRAVVASNQRGRLSRHKAREPEGIEGISRQIEPHVLRVQEPDRLATGHSRVAESGIHGARGPRARGILILDDRDAIELHSDEAEIEISALKPLLRLGGHLDVAHSKVRGEDQVRLLRTHHDAVEV